MVRSEESDRGHHVGLRGARRLRDHRTVRLWQVDVDPLPESHARDDSQGEGRREGPPQRGGQQQRLCIARALAVHPEVLLMDEPCAALDPIATAKIEDLIFDLKKDYTVVIVTHNMQQAARVAETTAFMYLGHLIEVGPTRELFERPKETLTESYITGRFG